MLLNRNIFHKISESTIFKGIILVLIILSGVILGFETYPEIYSKYKNLFDFLDLLIIYIFVLEAIIKILSYEKPTLYFKDSWNLFDFMVILLCILPLQARFALVLRLGRIFRFLRLISFFPELQLLVSAIIKSIPSFIYIFVLLILHFYVYAIIGTFLFSENDPLHFKNLHNSMLTLFSLVIVENWIDIFNINFYGCNINGYENSPIPCDHPNPQPILATLYFISFTIIGAMIILNLFIGVITNEIQETKKEIEKNNLKNINKPLEKKILSIQEKIQELSNEIKSLEESIKDDLGKKF